MRPRESFLPDFNIVITLGMSVIFTWFFLLHYVVGALFLLFFTITVFYWVRPQYVLFFVGCFFILQSSIVQLTRSPVVARLDELVILFLFLLTVMKSAVEKRPLSRTPIDLPLFGLIVIGTMGSVVYQIVSTPITLGGLLLFTKGFLIFYIFANTDFNEDHLRFYKKGFLIVGLLICVHGLLGAISPDIFLHPLGIIQQDRRFGLNSAQSVMGHPGAFSAFMAILACYSTAEGLMKGDRKALFLTALFVIAMILSLRRTSLLGFMIAILAVTFFQSAHLGSAMKRYCVTCLLILIFLLLCFSSFISVMYLDLIMSYVVVGDNPRSALLRSGSQIALDYFPLGSGFGTFGGGINQAFYSPLFYKYGLHRIWGLSPEKSSFINDSFWPHIIAETGIFGLILYFLMIAGMFRICTQSLTALKNSNLKIFAFAAYMTLIVSVVESSKATFYEMSLWTYFYFGAIAIVAALKQRENREKGVR